MLPYRLEAQIAVTGSDNCGSYGGWIDVDEDDDDTECEVGDGGQLVYTFDEPRTIDLKELTDGKIECREHLVGTLNYYYRKKA